MRLSIQNRNSSLNRHYSYIQCSQLQKSTLQECGITQPDNSGPWTQLKNLEKSQRMQTLPYFTFRMVYLLVFMLMLNTSVAAACMNSRNECIPLPHVFFSCPLHAFILVYLQHENEKPKFTPTMSFQGYQNAYVITNLAKLIFQLFGLYPAETSS